MEICEENFINELKAKNEKALDYILEQYGWIIKATVKKHLYNLQSVQSECINDILMAVWCNIDYFDENRSKFKNWLAGVSKYKCIDYKRKYLKNLLYEDIDNLDISVEDTSLKEILNNELSEDLVAMLNCLKEEDKDLFLKLYVQEKDISNICFETGMKRDVIYNRLSRGKKKIKRLFNLKESRV
jgi:RNA polymerase sigma-70 factor (ECF subfamily)